jgi:hypothetical protein
MPVRSTGRYGMSCAQAPACSGRCQHARTGRLRDLAARPCLAGNTPVVWALAPRLAGRAACLSVCGLITTRGYFNNPKRTTTLIGADGWLLSSDLSPGARQLP